MIGPRKPVTPATAIAARIALTVIARNGPINGIGSRMGVAAAPIARRSPAEVAPNCKFGTARITASTFHLPPARLISNRKSAVAFRKSENEGTGIVIVGQSIQIFGVQTFPTQGISMQTLRQAEMRQYAIEVYTKT
jgi:hypothetical protein